MLTYLEQGPTYEERMAASQARIARLVAERDRAERQMIHGTWALVALAWIGYGVLRVLGIL